MPENNARRRRIVPRACRKLRELASLPRGVAGCDRSTLNPASACGVKVNTPGICAPSPPGSWRPRSTPLCAGPLSVDAAVSLSGRHRNHVSMAAKAMVATTAAPNVIAVAIAMMRKSCRVRVSIAELSVGWPDARRDQTPGMLGAFQQAFRAAAVTRFPIRVGCATRYLFREGLVFFDSAPSQKRA
jgi:hypothetical protein